MKPNFKIIIALLALVVFSYQTTQAQSRLRIVKAKKETYNNYTRVWSGWPDEYTYFQNNSGPVLELTNLDDQGSNFRIEFSYNGSDNSFTVSYAGYDSKNGWYKYVDAAGDQICVLGATLSALAQNGWPSNKVQIYFWIDSENYALVLE